jgi:ABC-type antimicrobial peptide transport system permease subunit
MDPEMVSAAAAVFIAVGFAATYLPARRATRIDAMDAPSGS